MYKFIDTNFTTGQLRNYKRLRFLFDFAGWFAIGSIVLGFTLSIFESFLYELFYIRLPFEVPKFWIIVFALVLWVVLRVFTQRCLNCLKFNSLEGKEEKIEGDWSKYGLIKSKYDVLQILVVTKKKCKKCGFECVQISQRTGSYEGIGRMSRIIKQGGKPRIKGETYTSWWRRNK